MLPELARLNSAISECQKQIQSIQQCQNNNATEKEQLKVNTREIQYQWDGQRGKEFYDRQKVVRLTETQCRDFRLACLKVGLKEATAFRLFVLKFCDKINNYPPEMRREAATEIESATNLILEALPQVKRQLQANPRKY